MFAPASLKSSLDFKALAQEFKTPLFVYDHTVVVRKVQRLKEHLSDDIKIYYAAKANPNKELLRSLQGVVDGIDISSAGEIRQAVSVGWKTDVMSFAGPGKREAELRYSVEQDLGSHSVESVTELKRLDAIASKLGKQARISVRVNPKKLQKKFAIKMGGRPTQFGVDEEALPAFLEAYKETQACDLTGLHVYAGTQCLDAESLISNMETTLEIAGNLVRQGIGLKKINFGGGFGIPYYEGQPELDGGSVCDALSEKFRAFKQAVNLPELAGVLEFGRYLVGEAGVYLTQVLDVKESQGHVFCVLDGGMNHHLAASGNLGQIVRKNYRIMNFSREDGPKAIVNFVGPLCTSIDLMGDDVETVRPEIGDYIGFLNSGAYAYTASPLLFLSHDTPREVLVEEGKPKLIRGAFGCEAFD